VREIVVEPTTVSGTAPGAPAPNWWPWIVAGLVVAGLLYLSATDDEQEEDDDDRPLGGAG
jgi:hypothetical protein